jgi:outer membrane lipopolysaccharide assembly protein LptE/RlpB
MRRRLLYTLLVATVLLLAVGGWAFGDAETVRDAF